MEEAELASSTLFHSDQRLCYAESLPLHEVAARIEVAVLNFLRNLCSATPSVSNLPLVSRKFDNCGFRRGLMSDTSSILLSHSIFTRSLMKVNHAKAFIRDELTLFCALLSTSLESPGSLFSISTSEKNGHSKGSYSTSFFVIHPSTLHLNIRSTEPCKMLWPF